MALIKKEGFDYEFDPAACEECNGKCCRGEPGDIWVNSSEIDAISLFLNVSVFLFTDTYLHRVGNRFSIKERFTGHDYECQFLSEGEEKRCRIYPVRPAQCRSFPFWSYYRTRIDALVMECPGIHYPKKASQHQGHKVNLSV